MESISTVSTSLVLPPGTAVHRRRRISCLHPNHRHRYCSISSFSNPRLKPLDVTIWKLNAVNKQDENNNGGDDEDEEVDKALRLDGTIPGSSNEFVQQVSSRAYDMRRHLQQTFDSISYDGTLINTEFL